MLHTSLTIADTNSFIMSSISSEIKGLNPELETKQIEFLVQFGLYPEDVVLKVCYSLGASLLNVSNDGINWKIKVLVPSTYSEQNISKLEADINQELVDYKLRKIIFSETEVTRNLILANAFANTSLSK